MYLIDHNAGTYLKYLGRYIPPDGKGSSSFPVFLTLFLGFAATLKMDPMVCIMPGISLLRVLCLGSIVLIYCVFAYQASVRRVCVILETCLLHVSLVKCML